MVKRKQILLGYSAAFLSALLVGLFTVINKSVLSDTIPPLTAGAWTYFAAGMALLPFAIRAGRIRFDRYRVLAGWILSGSLIGPSLYFIGLSLASSAQGALMINLEAVFTALIAFGAFKEHFSRTTLYASVAVIVGGIVVSLPTSAELLAKNTLGNLLIACVYLGWATENNFGRLLGEDNPTATLVSIKALAAALGMGLLAYFFGQPLSVPLRAIPSILASGAVALGLSLALFYFAMKFIGAGRTGLISSTSALWGAAAAVVFLHDPLSVPIVMGGRLMLLGIAALGSESL